MSEIELPAESRIRRLRQDLAEAVQSRSDAMAAVDHLMHELELRDELISDLQAQLAVARGDTPGG